MIPLKTRFNVDKRGKITTGIKVVNNNTEYPKTTDYFVVDEFSEIVAVYGAKPKKLVIVFPDDEITSFFDVNYVLYGSNNQLIRKCDGSECVHRIAEELEVIGDYINDTPTETSPHKVKYEAGEISNCVCKIMSATVTNKQGASVRNPKLCSPAMYMKAFVLDYKSRMPISPSCYLFYSGSENTAANIYSELIKTKNFFGGRIKGIPFGLSVEMVSGRNAKTKFPIWNLQILGTVGQLQQLITESFMFDYKTISFTPESRQIESGKSGDINEEPDDIIEETEIPKTTKFDMNNPLGL